MRTIVLALSLFLSAGAALAQEPATPSATQDVEAAARNVTGSAGVSLVDFERVMKDGGCNPKAISDPRFVADAKNAIRPLIHEEDAHAMLTNKKAVVGAYAALLGLLVAFVVLLQRRQARLASELHRLRAELDRALEDDE